MTYGPTGRLGRHTATHGGMNAWERHGLDIHRRTA